MQTTNIALNTIAVTLISLGATTIGHELLTGAIEIILGVLVFAIYEFTPAK